MQGCLGHTVSWQELCSHDKREVRKFQLYLRLCKEGRKDELLKRRFWRRYLGLEV